MMWKNTQTKEWRRIVVQRSAFVNGNLQQKWALAWVGVFSLLLAVFGSAVLESASGQESSSALYDQAVSALGGPSRIWMMGAGDTGMTDFTSNGFSEDQGVIVQWDSKQVVLVRAGASNRTTLPGDMVVRIAPAWKISESRETHDAYSKGDFSKVLTLGQKALKSKEAPQWQQRLIVAEMVESAKMLEKWQVAGQVFGYLAKDNPPQLLLSIIPIPWGEESAKHGERMQESAAKWMADDNESIRLLGASWGVAGPDRGAAIEILEKLGKSASPLVANYAKCQLWRTVPPATVLSDHYPQWLVTRDRVFMPAQAGPSMLIADRLARASQTSMAIQEWLRVAALHSDHKYLVNKATQNAIGALKVDGRGVEAERVEKRFSNENPSTNR